MAGIDVGGGHGGKRATNHEIPLIPFIDFLLCLVAFLLVTAVWSQMARINADARVPGPPKDEPPEEVKKEKQLNVEMKDTKFVLIWKEGNTVVSTIDVEKKAVPVGNEGDIRYPDLAKKIVDEWNQNGSHRGDLRDDKKTDQAVLHSDNSTPFAEVVAVIDAIYTPKRDCSVCGPNQKKIPGLNVTFSVN
ncbi:MAG TPA: biopolymer transporter ExbD [Polyangiaceae bacterium]|nr:biopolymer transporter ExbD [Polyangiaceae bacterium]